MVEPAPEGVELQAEVAEGSEADLTYEFLHPKAVNPLELSTPSRGMRSNIDHLNPILLAEVSELLREEADPVVHVNSLRPPPALECPPKVVDGLLTPLPAKGSGHYQEARVIVPDCVDVDLPSHPFMPKS